MKRAKCSSDAEKPTKKTNAEHLVELKRGSYVSQSALAEKLAKVRQDGIPEASSRSSQVRARKKIANLETTYGPCVVDCELQVGGKMQMIALTSPFAVLHRCYHECPEFRRTLLDAFQRTPPSKERPWSLAIYFDAVSPNNPLQKRIDTRDMQMFYWTLLELCKMSHVDYWFTGAACRTVLVHKLEGGMSRFLGLVMRTFFTGVHDMRKTGVVLDVHEDGSELRLFVEHVTTVADYKALAEISDGFGATALKPCPSCRRLVSHAKTKVPIAGLGITPFTSLQPEDFVCMNACIHAHKTTHPRTHNHACTQNAHAYTCIQNTHTRAHGCTHLCMHTCIHTKHTCMHNTHTRTHECAHTCTIT